MTLLIKHLNKLWVYYPKYEKGITLGATSETGLLYATYYLLRLQATEADLSHLYISECPAYDLRILNHWDNLDGTIERGYAGQSLWNGTICLQEYLPDTRCTHVPMRQLV